MAKTAWITDTDLETYLTGLGVTAPAGMDVQDAIDGAVAALEQALGHAYLAEAVAGDYTYDPPGGSRNLLLGGPYAEIESVEVAGVAQVEGTDYWTNPSSGPFTWIEFSMFMYGDPHSITVSGRKGFSDTIPLDLWEAVRDYAVGTIYNAAAIAGTVLAGAASEISQGQVKVKMGPTSIVDGLREKALSVFANYRSPTVSGLR